MTRISYKTASGEIETLLCLALRLGSHIFAANRYQVHDGQVFDERHRRVGFVVEVAKQ